jgi:translation initiation factor 2B subunit (eIF-2B alpha/beta/delta family)
MEKERNEEQVRLYELNKRFLAEVEKGAEWKEVKDIIDQMREVARRIERLQPATIISIDNYPLENSKQGTGY